MSQAPVNRHHHEAFALDTVLASTCKQAPSNQQHLLVIFYTNQDAVSMEKL